MCFISIIKQVKLGICNKFMYNQFWFGLVYAIQSTVLFCCKKKLFYDIGEKNPII